MTTESEVKVAPVIGNPLPPEDIKVKPEPEPTKEEQEANAAAVKAADEAAAAKAKSDKDKADADDKAKADPAGKTEWAKIDNPVYTSVIEMLDTAKVSPLEGAAIFDKAVESGNLADIDWKTLEKKVTPGQFTLIKAGVEKYYNDAYEPVKQTVAKGHEIVGGEENWNRVKDWAQAAEKKDPALKKQIDDIRSAIGHNGAVAEFAIQKLKSLYEAAPGNKGLGINKIVLGDNKPTPSGDALTAAEYQKLNRELHSGMRDPDPSKVAELRARRKAGMLAGM